MNKNETNKKTKFINQFIIGQRKQRQTPEDDDCKALVKYMELFPKIKFTHIPNETFTKSWSVKMRNKAMGVRPGFLDYVILFKQPSGKNVLLVLEMKREKGGVVSKEQKQWIKELKLVDRVDAGVAHGFNEAKRIIDSYATKDTLMIFSLFE